MPIDHSILDRIRVNDPSLPEVLNFRDQNLQATDIKELVEALQNNDHITGLDLNNNKIEDEGVILLARLNTLKLLWIAGNGVGEKGAFALTNNKSITSLDISYNKINDKGAIYLASNPVPTDLNLAGNQITSIGAGFLADNGTLTSLNLTENSIGDEGAIALGENNKTLISLILIGAQIGDKGGIALAQHPRLNTLILANNKIRSDGTRSLALNSRLKTLDLSYNKLTAPGVIAFIDNSIIETLSTAGNQINNWGVQALLQCKSLTSLDASYNQVGDAGIKDLLNSSKLVDLNLNYNLISPKGAEILAQHPTLDKLHIRYNLLGDAGVAIIAKSRSIRWLDVTGNQAGLESAEGFAKNTRLEHLFLSYNLLGDKGARLLAEKNFFLRELWLSYNQISDEGASAFIKNHSLETLGLNYNYISPAGREALQRNKTLRLLQISKEQPPEFTAENLNNTFLLSQDFLCIRSKEGGIIQFFNPSFPRVLGYQDDELLGKSIYELVHPEDRLNEIELSETEQKFPINYHENRYRCKDGSYRTIWWSSQLKHNRIYTVGTDITEQKQSEKMLIQKQRKIESAAIAAQAAQAYTKEQSDFIAHLCHEIRNPLSGVYGNVEIARDWLELLQALNNRQDVSPIQKEIQEKIADIKSCLEAIAICTEHQKSILDDNLDVAKIAEKKFVLENNIFDFKEVIHTIIKMLKANAEKKGIELKAELPKEEMKVKGDAARIKKIIINLINNAIKFTEVGRITVEVLLQEKTSEYTQIEIKVTDTGMGLDEQQIQGLFERFSQASATIGSQYGGSGLGLLIARSLARLMGGDIHIESQKGKGSTFSCVIRCNNLSEEEKLVGKQAVNKKKLGMSSVASTTSLPPLREFTVLVVDDNDMNRKTLAHFIKKAGYKCLFAINGQEAVEKYNSFPIDIILMDLLMPVMNGIKATQCIRQREIKEGLPPVPIIAITGNAMEGDQKEALVAGVNAYITKPFSQKDVLKQIGNFLAAAPTSSMVPQSSYEKGAIGAESLPQTMKDIPILTLSYQEIFIQTVKYLLFNKWKNKFPNNSLEYQFIDNLATKILVVQEADDVFRKISGALMMSEYGQVKNKLAPLREELITLMKQYNANKLATLNTYSPPQSAEGLAKIVFARSS